MLRFVLKSSGGRYYRNSDGDLTYTIDHNYTDDIATAQVFTAAYVGNEPRTLAVSPDMPRGDWTLVSIRVIAD